MSPARNSPPTAANEGPSSDVGPDGDPAQQELVVFAEQGEEARLGRYAVGQQRVFAAQHLVEFVVRAAHVPVAGDQPDGVELVLGEPAAGLLGVGTRVDGLAAEIDAALDQLAAAAEPPGDVAFGHRRISAGHQEAPGLALAKDIDRMLDPTASAGQDHGCVGRGSSCRCRFAEREGEEDEAQAVEQGNEGGEARDHSAWRNAESTAVRATHVARPVRASGRIARTSRSKVPRVAPPVSSPANAAPAESNKSTSVAAIAPATLPAKASIAILHRNRMVTCRSVAPTPCITSMVKRC